ncbi:hypothetical protein SAMN05192533_104149 [Mesobacillus persicus]|uniref:Molybdopterin cofactor biosynthesis MoaD-related C-terminal domain-containing protein n=1 Tax=Mesobacillus persicus TaxID=930146 RepID=A0A1H8A0G5_9BACI|nr:hypothetical protein [Mesobacillus persicus]SEM63338.1 hypothetical protein SAMN05192533_104149 [Mesobacillus persicus]
MASRELEFRGINRNHLGMYFEELGGELLTDAFPFVYKGNGWTGEILSEDKLTFTKTFKVNAVHIRFTAETESGLEDLIKQYRYKTTRVGG